MTERTYHRVTIPLSDAEFRRYLSKRCFTAAGTMVAAIRADLNLPDSPYGYNKHLETHTPPLTHGEQTLIHKGVTPGEQLADAVSHILTDLADYTTLARESGDLTLTNSLTDAHAELRAAITAYRQDTTTCPPPSTPPTSTPTDAPASVA